ncbi:hypothetical protein C8F04DRAFT_631875 [Mycena alexandri]|uniref:Uncharacterized protein n=1 Tax=Mycena alexandri TaxID=1745969 RepID=A0AAD6SV07_9AGAR|nr:hypothetical protein C8F04DRAFT_631875 [Mycena alexandri]
MFSLTSFYFLLASTLVSAAPVPRATLDKTTLLQNGQIAQNLNFQFQNLTANDACNTGDVACIQGDFATCVDDKWQTKGCLNSLSCFVVPSLSQSGANVTCTSERNALSTITSTGASNEIAVAHANVTDGSDGQDGSCDPDSGDNDNNDNGDDGDDTCDGGSSSSSAPADASTTPSATTTVAANGGDSTVTVTVTPSAATTVFITEPAPPAATDGGSSTFSTLSFSGTVTLQPQTTIVSGAEAASILSSLAAQGFTPVTTIFGSGSSPTDAPDNSNNGAATAGPSIIVLTTKSATPTPSSVNNAAGADDAPILSILAAPAASSPPSPAAAASSAAADPFPFSDY